MASVDRIEELYAYRTIWNECGVPVEFRGPWCWRRVTVSLLSNPRLRTPGVSPGVKASEGWEVFDLSFAFQVPRAYARGYLLRRSLTALECFHYMFAG